MAFRRPEPTWKEEILTFPLALAGGMIAAGEFVARRLFPRRFENPSERACPELLAIVAYDGIRKRAEAGDQRHLPPEALFGFEMVKDEWFYLDVFIVAYSAFHALGANEDVVLDPFSSLVASWLETRQAPPTPLRMGFDLKTFLPEDKEPAPGRLERRLSMYADAVRKPGELGLNHNVANTFSTLCGIHDAAYDLYLATYFSTRQVEWVKWLRSYPLDLASLTRRKDSNQAMLAIRLGGHKDKARMAAARDASDTVAHTAGAEKENEVRSASDSRDSPAHQASPRVSENCLAQPERVDMKNPLERKRRRRRVRSRTRAPEQIWARL